MFTCIYMPVKVSVYFLNSVSIWLDRAYGITLSLLSLGECNQTGFLHVGQKTLQKTQPRSPATSLSVLCVCKLLKAQERWWLYNMKITFWRFWKHTKIRRSRFDDRESWQSTSPAKFCCCLFYRRYFRSSHTRMQNAQSEYTASLCVWYLSLLTHPIACGKLFLLTAADLSTPPLAETLPKREKRALTGAVQLAPMVGPGACLGCPGRSSGPLAAACGMLHAEHDFALLCMLRVKNLSEPISSHTTCEPQHRPWLLVRAVCMWMYTTVCINTKVGCC